MQSRETRLVTQEHWDRLDTFGVADRSTVERKFEAIGRLYPDAHGMVWADATSGYSLLARTSILYQFSNWRWAPSTEHDLAYCRHVMAGARLTRASEVLDKMLEAGLTRDDFKDVIPFIEVTTEELFAK